VADVNPIDENNKTLVSCAAEYGHDNIVRILLRTGKIDLRANNNGSWLLHWAAAANDEEMITLLLDKGVDLDAKDFKDRTALWAAVYEGKSKAVKVFMKRSTALYSNLPDEEDILFLAAYEGDTETVESLLLRGINPQATDRWGAQPLHWAAYNGHEEVAKLFLTHGANVNALNPDDCTPLYLAIHMLNKAVVKTLLDAGADPSIPDRWGLSYSKEQCLRFTDQKHSAEHNLA
jgi:ankyrin repeat protein